MNILVIEDEKRNFTRLKKQLLEIDKDFEIEGPVDCVKDLKDILTSNKHYELILADIRINGGTCFDVFDEVRLDVPVIFTTAYDEYALKAFKSNGIAYLQKPFEVEELKEAIKKAMKMIEPEKEMVHLLSLLKESSKKKYKERFLVPRGEQLQIINSYSINHFMLEAKSTMMYLEDGSSVSINESVSYLEQELDPTMFFRINRQCIINLDDIVKIEMTWNGKLKLKLRHYDNLELEVSRDRVNDFKERLNR